MNFFQKKAGFLRKTKENALKLKCLMKKLPKVEICKVLNFSCYFETSDVMC